MNNMTPSDTIENLLELASAAEKAKTLLKNEQLKNSLSGGRKMVDAIIGVLNECGHTKINTIQDLPVSPVTSGDNPLFYEILHDAMEKMHRAKSDCILQELKFTQFDSAGDPAGKGDVVLIITSSKGMIKVVVEMELHFVTGQAYASIAGCNPPVLEVDGKNIAHNALSHRIATGIAVKAATTPGLFPERCEGSVREAQTLLSALSICAQGLPTPEDVSLAADYISNIK